MTELVPIKKVLFFQKGLALIERELKNFDGSEISIDFDPKYINDVLKSLTVIDRGKGRVIRFSYQKSTDQLEETNIDLNNGEISNYSIISIIKRIKNRKIRIFLGEPGRNISYSSPTTSLLGAIIGYSELNEESESSQVLTFIRENTSQVIFLRLNNISGIELIDDELVVTFRSELKKVGRKALTTVTIHLDNEVHDLCIRYAMPVFPWRVSYRLLLEDGFESNGRALLSGLIIFENTLHEDLVEVMMSFLSGTQGIAKTELHNPNHYTELQQTLNFSDNAQYQFEYSIPDPITIRKGETSIVSFLSAYVPCKRYLFYDYNRCRKYPFKGLRMINNTGFDFAEGPIAIFEGDYYLGESIIRFSKSGDELFLLYGYENNVEFNVVQKEYNELKSVYIKSGELIIISLQYLIIEYIIKSSLENEIILFLAHDIPDGYELIEPSTFSIAGKESNELEVLISPKSEKKFKITFQQILKHSKPLENLTEIDMDVLINNPSIDQSLCERLTSINDLNREIDSFQKELTKIQHNIEDEINEQARINKNLSLLSKDEIEDLLRKSYIQQLWESEKKIERLKQKKNAIEPELENLRTKTKELILSLEKMPNSME